MNVIKKKRFEKELSQIEIYKKTGIWPSRLSLIENNHVSPSLPERKILAAVLEIREERIKLEKKNRGKLS